MTYEFGDVYRGLCRKEIIQLILGLDLAFFRSFSANLYCSDSESYGIAVLLT
ncbi:MAG: hypothetical protein MRJ93_12640 [Nitrososphaeraceae archaeon]|nr:hypothetical protein [Nitrososphaeraceae archaeon]